MILNEDLLTLEFFKKVRIFQELRDVVVYTIQSEIKSNPYTAINYFKTRIKSFDRFKKKIDSYGILTIAEAFSKINDILGIRLICLYKTQLQEICDWVEANFAFKDRTIYLWDGVGDLTPSEEELKRTLETGYTAIHYIAKIKESQKRSFDNGIEDLKNYVFEIQICTKTHIEHYQKTKWLEV